MAGPEGVEAGARRGGDLRARRASRPPTLLAQASRLNFSTRLFNLIVTNVPGPQFPLYLLGREMEEIVPVAFLPENHALAIAIMSYNGKLDFGLLGDYDAMPDLEDLGLFIEDAVVELLEEARRRAKPVPQAPAAMAARRAATASELAARDIPRASPVAVTLTWRLGGPGWRNRAQALLHRRTLLAALALLCRNPPRPPQERRARTCSICTSGSGRFTSSRART